jgi:hypothetical protein
MPANGMCEDEIAQAILALPVERHVPIDTAFLRVAYAPGV